MRLALISDTHSFHRKIAIPECDVLLHCGDITWKGELTIIEDFANWLKELPAKHKVIIFGNHELGFQYGHKRKPAIQMIEDSGSIYLENSAIEIEGLKIYGSPATPKFFDWEWNYDRNQIGAIWQKIPDDTNVLMTHGMPYGIMDEVPRGFGQTERVGCKALLQHIDRLKELKLYVGGHLHPGYGTMDINGVKFVNASSCDNAYKPINPPIIIDL